MDWRDEIGEHARRYREQGHALLAGLIAPERGGAFHAQLLHDVRLGQVPVRDGAQATVLISKTLEVYSADYPPMQALHDALTLDIAAVAGRDLVATYSYFRIYRHGALCRVHADRPACEHSLSLMLAQGGDVPWALDVAAAETAPGAEGVRDDFGDAGHVSLPMMAGDGVVYRGVTRRHGRLTPNPNAWSAHLFLHWVDRDGPYAAHAHDEQRRAQAAALSN